MFVEDARSQAIGEKTGEKSRWKRLWLWWVLNLLVSEVKKCSYPETDTGWWKTIISRSSYWTKHSKASPNYTACEPLRWWLIHNPLRAVLIPQSKNVGNNVGPQMLQDGWFHPRALFITDSFGITHSVSVCYCFPWNFLNCRVKYSLTFVACSMYLEISVGSFGSHLRARNDVVYFEMSFYFSECRDTRWKVIQNHHQPSTLATLIYSYVIFYREFVPIFTS